MQPGDIVVGRVMELNNPIGIHLPTPKTPHSLRTPGMVDNMISVYSHKEAYLLSVVNIGNTKTNERYKDFKKDKLHVSKVRGMIVDFDPMNSKRPHIEGLAAVLIEDNVWWVVAGDLKVIKLGQGIT